MKNIITLIVGFSFFYLPAIAQTPTPIETPYLQNFEGTFLPTDWQTAHGSGGSSDWIISSIGIGGYGTSNYSTMFNNIGVPNSWYVLRTPSFDFTSATSPILKFDFAYARYDSDHSDSLTVFYTTNTNGTSGWSMVIDAISSSSIVISDDTLATAPNQTTPFTPTDTQWQTFTVDLSNYIGASYIRFAFESVADTDTDGSNIIYIDNVRFYDSNSQVDPTLSIANEYIEKFSIYPNPSKRNFFIQTELKDLTESNIQVFNSIGQEFQKIDLTPTAYGYKLNLDTYQKGIYYVTVITKNQKFTKIIILE